MATYDGARFLAEQLESLADQEVLPCELVVCDDGSTDGTPEMVERFAATAPFPVRLYRNERNLGFAENFLKTARLCDGDWVAFCDQDDVWLPNKIGRAAEAIRRDPALCLILQNALICDAALTPDGRIFPDLFREGTYGAGSRYGFWVWPGFLQTFSAKYLDLSSALPLPANYFPGHKMLSHDKWTCLLANATGGIRVLSEPVAFYRRHGAALTGDYGHQTTTDRVSKSLAVGSDHYDFLAAIAQETAAYLRALAKIADAATAGAFRHAARGFDAISAIQTHRSALYSATSLPARLSLVLRIAARGGYVGPGIVALGWKSGAKDLAHALGLFGLLRKVVR